MNYIQENIFREEQSCKYKVSEEKLRKVEEAIRKLEAYEQHLGKNGGNFLGYPCNRAFDLDPFFNWWIKSTLSMTPLNDAGNPDNEPTYKLNVRPFERELIKKFATLYNLSSKEAWGYTTSGGTLGNEQGLYLGREYLRKYGNVVLYVSEEAHYSIRSLGRILDVEMKIIPSNTYGVMCYDELEKQLEPNRPALFSISIGTTFKGAIDDIGIIKKIVKKRGIEHVYYHADAALFGGHLAYLEDSQAPKVDFEKHPFDSIAVSGHKFFGSPIPVGFFLTKRKYIADLQEDYIEYINSSNVTIPCSRSALSILILWWELYTKSEEYPKEANDILQGARYLKERLEAIGCTAYLNEYSNTVYFATPSKHICQKWLLATTHCTHLGDLAHVVVMQHVDKALLDRFIADMEEEQRNELQKIDC